jgi:beta-galactosidase
MGNSSGGLKEYWDIFYSGTNAQGAFVWDWVDQGIKLPVPGEYRMNSKSGTFLAYGGWWEDKTGIRNDNNFNNNGLVSADRKPHPGLWAIKYVYRYLHASAVDVPAGKVRVKNWYFFRNAKEVAEGLWEVKAGGRTVASGKLDELDIAPLEEKEFTIALPSLTPEPGVDYRLNLSFVLRADAQWAPKGHEIAWEQFALPSVPGPAIERKNQALALDDRDSESIFTGPDFSAHFDKKAGVITSYTYKGAALLERGPRPDFWRAGTDNDRGAAKSVRDQIARDRTLDLNLWRNAGPRWKVNKAEVKRIDDSTASIEVSASLAGVDASYSVRYRIHASGDVIVECRYTPGTSIKMPMMPRFGTELVVAPGYENIAWYGRGPVETYNDRNFERIGLYQSTIDKEWVAYSRPQENGNKTDVRWVALTNQQGAGILAVGASTLSVAARHFAKEEVDRAGYDFQMARHPQVFFNVDRAQMGVGGIDSWSRNAWPMRPYRIAPDAPHDLRYRLSPVSSVAEAEKKAREAF